MGDNGAVTGILQRRRWLVARQHVVTAQSVDSEVRCNRPDDTQPVRLFSQPAEALTDLNPRHVGCYRLILATYFRGSLRLQIEGVQMSRTAV